MNIEELENLQTQHYLIWKGSDKTFYSAEEEHTKLSVGFAISVLESIDMSLHLNSEAIYSKRQQKFIEDKIKELKQYLDE